MTVSMYQASVRSRQRKFDGSQVRGKIGKLDFAGKLN
jgi:hypothetical protein